MPITPKFKVQADRQGDSLWLTDLTGEYQDPDNKGGYGTPNFDLNQICMVALIKRNGTEGEVFLESTWHINYDPSLGNDEDDTYYNFTYVNDGWHTAYYAQLPVSANGDVDKFGNLIGVDEYFYFTKTDTIHKKIGPLIDEVEEVENVEDILLQDNLVVTQCEDFFMSNLSELREEEYQDYRKNRSGVCAPNSRFNRLREMTEDLISSNLTFKSGLMENSQMQIEHLLSEKNL
jgi:hypothetical protein